MDTVCDRPTGFDAYGQNLYPSSPRTRTGLTQVLLRGDVWIYANTHSFRHRRRYRWTQWTSLTFQGTDLSPSALRAGALTNGFCLFSFTK